MRKYLLIIFIMFVVASCGTAPPIETDWCWTFDFTASDNGFSLENGAWVEDVGLQSAAGILSFSYGYTEFVEPALLAVTVARPNGIEGDINVLAGGLVFGSSISSINATLPATSELETVWFEPANQGDAGTDINVMVDVGSQDIIIKSIRVEGFDETPFPSNPCADPSAWTPTVAPSETPADFTPSPTNTPTHTPSPTPTNTPTETSTPSETPEPSTWCYTFDFTSDSYSTIGAYTGWYLGDWGDSYVSGQGWKSESYNSSQELLYLRLDFPIDVVLTDVAWTITSSAGNSGSAAWNPNTGVAIYLDGSQVSSILIPLSGQPVNQTFSWSGSSTSDGLLIASNPLVTQSLYYTEIVLNGGGSAPFPSLENECPSEPTSTPEASATATTTLTPIGLPPTATPFNYQPTVDLTQITATPSVTPQPTSTDYPISTAYATQTIGAETPTPSVEEIRENEAEWVILEEQQRSNNAVENLLQDILDALTGDGSGDGSGDDGGAGGDGGTGEGTTITDGVSDWFSAISNSLSSIAGLFGRVGVFFNQAANSANGLATSFYTAPLEPIPGMPLCMTDPLTYDICAIYYILDWTLFAPGTYGAFIIPLLLAIMNTIIIFRVLRYVLKLIKRTEDVTR